MNHLLLLVIKIHTTCPNELIIMILFHNKMCSSSSTQKNGVVKLDGEYFLYAILMLAINNLF